MIIRWPSLATNSPPVELRESCVTPHIHIDQICMVTA